jgi:membrane-associated phospholipid phosphatase
MGRRILLSLGIVLPLLGFAALARAVGGDELPGWDSTALRAAKVLDDRDRTGYVLTAGLQATMLVGALVALGILVSLLRFRHRREALLWVLAVGGAVLLDPVLKAAFQRDAIGGNEWSFPSGNAMVSMTIVSAAVLLLWHTEWRRWALVLGTAIVVGEGAWLVALQWHYPSDVVAGWCAGLSLVFSLALALGFPRGGLRLPRRRLWGERVRPPEGSLAGRQA